MFTKISAFQDKKSQCDKLLSKYNKIHVYLNNLYCYGILNLENIYGTKIYEKRTSYMSTKLLNITTILQNLII